jgi:ATP-binding cassette subfamily A (ABC1) protein 3
MLCAAINFPAFTIGDESELYSKTNLDNPSLPLLSIMQRLSRNGVLLALAPGDFSNELYSQVQNISSYILIQTGGLYGESIKLFDSKDQMDDYMTDRHYDDDGYGEGKIGLAILLYQADVENMQWNYAVRTNFTYVWEQEDDDPSCLYGQGNGTCDFTYCTPTTKEYTQDLYKPQSMEFIYGYSFSGFSTLQITMDSYIFSQYSSTVNIMASIGLMPTEDYETDDFQYVISSTLGIFYMLSFLYPVSRMIRSLVLEKEQKIKEGMKMMGLTDFAYNLSWLITTVTQMTVVSGLIVLVTMTSVFEYSNSFLVFVYFMAFSLAVINMCFLMATCFSKSKIASLMGPMIFFATFFPYYAVQDPAYSPQVKAATCLLAPSCFALGANVFADFEGGLVGVQMSNFSQETSNFSYSLCVGMMLVDAVLYGILAWYFDKVIPSEYGTQLPLYFPILPSYWCGVEIVKKDQVLEQPLLTHSNEDSSKVEVVSEELTAQEEDGKCLIIRNLRKVFKTTAEDRVAVDCLNLNVYEGQVTVLLGHNGAGKSTTISMLTGLINPSAGDATIQGQFLSSNLQNIRKSLGVCPQHDILFPEMTVLQHLEMFAIFKGVDSSKVNDAAMKMIREVGLKEKTNYQSCMLSGGQKRKLSLGIALIGDSKVIILDEPTSGEYFMRIPKSITISIFCYINKNTLLLGMDPYSRRSTWNIIQRNRKGRIILMTTHFMDEADLLGDRIAIMGEGRLRCVGSSMFLKKVYGVGYTFTVVRSAQGVGGEPVVDLVTSHVPEADVLSNVGAEQSFRLPFSASAKFVELFTETESKKQELGISEYGISVTTLEEVFIRVGKNTEDITTRESIVKFAEENEQRRSMSLSNNDDGDDIKIAMKLLPNDNDGNLFAKHFRALFLKRYIYGKRDMRMLFCQVILPVMLVVLGLGLLQLRPGFDQVKIT